MVFVVLVCLVALLRWLASEFENSKMTYCTLMSICLIFVAGFRSYRVGTDTAGYVLSFLNCPPLDIEVIKRIFGDREFLFSLYQSCIKLFTSNYTFFLLPIAIFFTISISRFVYKYSSSPAISYLLFMSMMYFTFSMAGLRQTVAIGILLFALDKLLDKKYVPSALLILLAACFHITALSFFAIFAIYFLPLNGWYIGVTAALSLLCYFNGSDYIGIIVDAVWGATRGYTATEYGGISMIILLVAIAVLTLLLYPQLLQRKVIVNSGYIRNHGADTPPAFNISGNIRCDTLFAKMLLFSIPMQVLAIFQANAFRIAMMFHVVILAILPNVINAQKDKSIRTVGKIIVVFSLLLQLFAFTYHVGDINPFTFFWEL